MTLDITKPVETQDGRKVTVIKTNVGSDRQIVGTILFHGDNEKAFIWNENGDITGGWTSDYNLVNAPVKETRWIPLYNSDSSSEMYSYLSESEARACAFHRQCGSLEVFYEDGIPVNVIFHKEG